jgi:hypothetical protein
MKAVLLTAAAFLIVGCAADPKTIQASYVSATQYATDAVVIAEGSVNDDQGGSKSAIDGPDTGAGTLSGTGISTTRRAVEYRPLTFEP